MKKNLPSLPARIRQASEVAVARAGWVPAWIIFGALLFLFSPFFLAERVLAPLDIVQELYQPWCGEKKLPRVHNHFVTDTVENFLPNRQIFHESLRTDGYAGWNPYVFGGTAQHANTMLVNHEATMSLHRVLDFWPAWVLGRLFQFLAAGLGMLVFLRGQGCRSGVALLGAMAYMLNQQFVAYIYFNQVVAAFCWIPWALWALFRARTHSPRFVALAAIFIWLAFLGATLQQAVFVSTVFACLGMGWFWENRAKPKVGLRLFLMVLFAGLAGLGAAAFSIQPSVAAFWENAQAGHGRGMLGYEDGPWQPLLNFLGSPLTAYPFVLGSVQNLDLWKLFRLVPFHVSFYGTLTMILAGAGFFSRRVPMAAKMMMLAGVVVPLTPLVGYLYHRFSIVWILGGCWAACSWLAQAERAELLKLRRFCARLFSLLTVLWLFASLSLAACRGFLEPWLQKKVLAAAGQSKFGFFSSWMEERVARWMDYSCLWSPWQLLGLCGLFLSLWGLGRIQEKRPAAFFCALGVFLQLSVFWWQWTTWSRPELPYGTTSLEKLLQKEIGSTGRLAMDVQSPEEMFLPYNTLMPLRIPITEGYDAMHPHGMISPSGLKWDFPGTTHFLGKVAGAHPETWELIWKKGKWGLWRNPNPAAARVRLDSVGTWQLIPVEQFRRLSANTMEIDLPAGSHKAEVFCNWHRGWLWQIEGEDMWEQAQAGENRTLQVSLPSALADQKKIKFRYVPARPFWVLAISAGSGFAMVLGLCLRPRSFLRVR